MGNSLWLREHTGVTGCHEKKEGSVSLFLAAAATSIVAVFI